MARTLILNGDGSAIHISDARHALLQVIDGTAFTVVESDSIVHSQFLEFALPSVIQLYKYINVPRGRSIPLTTRTVLARDRFRCGYCLGHADTMDHIHPRGQGGKHTWENTVSACRRCNHKKGNRTPEQANMPLLIEPRRPKGAHAKMLLYSLDAAWEPYLLSHA